MYCYCQSHEILFRCYTSDGILFLFRWYSLDGILLENFISSNSIILVEDLIKQNRFFEIFLIDHCAGDIGNKNISGNY